MHKVKGGEAREKESSMPPGFRRLLFPSSVKPRPLVETPFTAQLLLLPA